jgi:predicted phage tail protein
MSKRLLTGSGGGGCFLGHTLVRVPDGQRRIDEIQPNDLVLSFDDKGVLHQAKILKVHEHEGERVIRYHLWGGVALDATPNHWVLNQFNAFVEIDTLGSDDCLVDENGHLRPIVSREPLESGTVYNLTVEGHHTFIAGGVRVHNAGLGLGITGAGGGGGGKGGGGGGAQSQPAARTPTITRDSLDSKQYATFVDLVSEGEIQGLKNGLQSIFLNNTPLQNPDGSLNFQNVTVDTRTGTQNQSYIPVAAQTEDEKPVNTEVQAALPVIRSITDTNVNGARITITVPQLQRFTSEGDQLGASVSLAIAVQYSGGGYTTVITDTISGRTADLYARDYLINFSGAYPIDVRVTRTTADSTDPNLVNKFLWTSYTEIIYAKLRYPNSALVAMRVDAEQFSSIPSRAYLIRGIKVQIPSNATVDSTTGRLIYSGIWNGTFGAAQWCSDPAWILWDLLTSTRYGFGDHIEAAQLDKFAFYAASQYSSELVPDGFGGQEPRFSCNVNIQTAEDAYKLINDMCSVMRVMPYWSTGALTISQDKPADTAYLFTLANVTEEGFSYQGGSRKTRPTVCVVSYLDINSRDTAYEVVEDAEAIQKYGVVKTEISAFACTSRGQAYRIGEWLLYSERYESEIISFMASIDAGVLVRPGQIIEVADPVKAGARRGGRISAATTTAITVDDATGLTAAGAELSVIMPDGSVQTRTIATGGIAGNVITVSTAFSVAPNVNSVWIYQTNDIETSTWRVLTVQEQDGSNYAINAIAYNASKYDYIERGTALEQRDITNLNEPAGSPQAMTFREVLYEDAGQVLCKLVISWLAPVNERGKVSAVSYRVQWRRQDGNWTQDTVTTQEYVIYDTAPGNYEVIVYGMNAGGFPSAVAARLDVSARGKLIEPAGVQNLTIEQISANSARLRWDATTDLDVKVGGRVHIRHTSVTDGTGTWATSQDLIPAVPGYSTEAIVPMVEGEYLVKFEDSSDKQSLTEASVVVDLPDPLSALPVIDRREDTTVPPFLGESTNLFYSAAYQALTLGGTALFDTIPNFDLLADLDYYGDTATTGTYVFNNILDLEAKYSLDIRRHLVGGGFYPSDLLDARTDPIDTWINFESAVAGQANSKICVRTTDDDPTGTPTWSNYQEFGNGTFTARAFQFKLDASMSDPVQAYACYELGYKASFQRRIESSVVAEQSGAGTKSVSFTNPFWTGSAALGGVNSTLPSIGITAQNLQSGDYFNVTNVTKNGFDVTFRNSSGTAVDRLFAWSALGYGKGA